jgi:hypothetical protein
LRLCAGFRNTYVRGSIEVRMQEGGLHRHDAGVQRSAFLNAVILSEVEG